MKNEMKDKTMLCEECGNKINEVPDSRGYIACENCGLVANDKHPTGKTLNDLISYMNHQGLQSHTESIRTIGTFQGLRDARLEVARMVLNK
jgi:uncharacterized Zn finger protein